MEKLNNFLELEKTIYMKEHAPLAYISFLYIVYNIKLEYPLINHFSLFQFNSKVKYYRKKETLTQEAYSILLKVHGLSHDFDSFFKLAYSLDIDELKEFILEEIVAYGERYNLISKELEKVVNSTIPDKLKNNVCIISPTIPSLVFKSIEKDSVIDFTFFEQDSNFISLIYFNLKGVKATLIDSLNPVPSQDKVFDLISIFPPYRNTQLIQMIEKGYKRQDASSSSLEWKLINDSLDTLSSDGRLIAFVQTGILNKVADSPSRKSLTEQKLLNMVVEMPRIQNYPQPLSFIVITHNNTKGVSLVNASKFVQNERRGVNINVDKVIRAVSGQIEGAIGIANTDYLRSNSYDLTPHRFFEVQSTEFSNTVFLKDVTTQVFRGFQIPSEMLDEYLSEEETKIKLLTLSSIEDGQVIKEELQSLKGIDKKMEHYVIKNNDLVISCKGKTFKTAVIEVPHNETYVSTGSLIVIRCDLELIDPTYLKIYLDSDIGVKQLQHIQTGTNVLSLNPTQLIGIKVPLPELSHQITISAQYKYKTREILELKNMLEELKKEKNKKYNTNLSNLLK